MEPATQRKFEIINLLYCSVAINIGSAIIIANLFVQCIAKIDSMSGMSENFLLCSYSENNLFVLLFKTIMDRKKI